MTRTQRFFFVFFIIVMLVVREHGKIHLAHLGPQFNRPVAMARV